jgi:hypothetical protein
MTVHTVGTKSPTVFDAGLPAIAYEHAQNPDEAHRLIRQARVQGPIALGPHGPEVLSYELVRTVLRDPRFCMPKGLVLAAQGITSARLWDKATTGRSLIPAADNSARRAFLVAARVLSTVLPTLAGVCGWHSWTAASDSEKARAKNSSSRLLRLDPRRCADTEVSLQAGIEDCGDESTR